MQETGAVAQAVSTADFKRSVHLAVAETADDLLIEAYLKSAQALVEDATRQPMTARSVQFYCRPKGWGRWFVPVAPVAAVTGAHWQSAAGGWTALSLTGLRVELAQDEPQVVWPDGWLDGIEDGAVVRFALTAGHADLALRPQLRQAVLLIAKTWYDAGIAVDDDKAEAPQPFGARALMRQVRFERAAEYGVA